MRQNIYKEQFSQNGLNLLVSVIILGSILVVCGGCSKGIEGRVVDNFGKPIAELQVMIPDSAFKATTNAEGRFRIDYSPGAFQIAFSKPGYISLTRSLNLAKKVLHPLDDTKLWVNPPPNKLCYISDSEYIPLEPVTMIYEDEKKISKVGFFSFEFKERRYSVPSDVPLLQVPAHTTPVLIDSMADPYSSVVKAVGRYIGMETYKGGFNGIKNYPGAVAIDDFSDQKERITPDLVLRRLPQEPGIYAFIKTYQAASRSFTEDDEHGIRREIFCLCVSESCVTFDKTKLATALFFELPKGFAVLTDPLVTFPLAWKLCETSGSEVRIGSIYDWRPWVKKEVTALIESSSEKEVFPALMLKDVPQCCAFKTPWGAEYHWFYTADKLMTSYCSFFIDPSTREVNIVVELDNKYVTLGKHGNEFVTLVTFLDGHRDEINSFNDTLFMEAEKMPVAEQLRALHTEINTTIAKEASNQSNS